MERKEQNTIATKFKPTCLAAFSVRSAGSIAHHAFLTQTSNARAGNQIRKSISTMLIHIHIHIRIRIRIRALVSDQVPAALSPSQLAGLPWLVCGRLVSHPSVPPPNEYDSTT